MNTKKIFGGIAVIVIAVAMVINVNFSVKDNDLSDISLANVEALARVEMNNSGDWVVTVLGPHSWQCDKGGKICCPNFYSEAC